MSVDYGNIVFSSPMVGFKRFLYLVGNHDWKNSPLMVNLNDEFTGKCLITCVN